MSPTNVFDAPSLILSKKKETSFDTFGLVENVDVKKLTFIMLMQKALKCSGW
jgi:hypothetical protein